MGGEVWWCCVVVRCGVGMDNVVMWYTYISYGDMAMCGDGEVVVELVWWYWWCSGIGGVVEV